MEGSRFGIQDASGALSPSWRYLQFGEFRACKGRQGYMYNMYIYIYAQGNLGTYTPCKEIWGFWGSKDKDEGRFLGSPYTTD